MTNQTALDQTALSLNQNSLAVVVPVFCEWVRCSALQQIANQQKIAVDPDQGLKSRSCEERDQSGGCVDAGLQTFIFLKAHLTSCMITPIVLL
jgi:hypothetical protein